MNAAVGCMLKVIFEFALKENMPTKVEHVGTDQIQWDFFRTLPLRQQKIIFDDLQVSLFVCFFIYRVERERLKDRQTDRQTDSAIHDDVLLETVGVVSWDESAGFSFKN